MTLSGLVATLDRVEREEEDLDAAAFAGSFSKMLHACLKEKGE